MTWKHVIIVALGLGAACFGAWITIVSPASVGAQLIIALGSNMITGALAHAGHGITLPGTKPTAEKPGGTPSSYVPSEGSMPHELR